MNGKDQYANCYALPPGPICVDCNHELCPCCPYPWCDRLTHEVEDNDLCCDGDCTVDAADFAMWQRECRKREAEYEARPLGSYITLAEGPFLPAAVRRERGLAL